MKPRILPALSPYLIPRSCRYQASSSPPLGFPTAYSTPSIIRTFTTTSSTLSWLIPKRGHTQKNRKGRPRVPTGGSTRGTTVVWGEYGLRMRDHDRRISSKQLSIGYEAIRQRLRGKKFRIYTRVAANIGVYTSGNEQRMGKGKGSFDYWAARVAVSQIVFEVKAALHEQIIRDALRLAGNKLPGLYEIAKKGDPPVMGLTKMEPGVTLADMKKPLRKLPADSEAVRLSSTSLGELPEEIPTAAVTP
ncbi:hypothetical protein N7G274_006448 [Stereocaulon virgatum]|uniref:Ribosomal protein L16 n=1 Tax=Stereocaulon virgatum TaxID=373712 RepID=A0ABR4A6B0_9LECA